MAGGGLFGGKKTRQEQLDEQEKKAAGVNPEPEERMKEDVMYADGAFGMKKKHGKAKKRSGGGGNYPW